MNPLSSFTLCPVKGLSISDETPITGIKPGSGAQSGGAPQDLNGRQASMPRPSCALDPDSGLGFRMSPFEHMVHHRKLPASGTIISPLDDSMEYRARKSRDGQITDVSYISSEQSVEDKRDLVGLVVETKRLPDTWPESDDDLSLEEKDIDWKKRFLKSELSRTRMRMEMMSLLEENRKLRVKAHLFEMRKQKETDDPRHSCSMITSTKDQTKPSKTTSDDEKIDTPAEHAATSEIQRAQEGKSDHVTGVSSNLGGSFLLPRYGESSGRLSEVDNGNATDEKPSSEHANSPSDLEIGDVVQEEAQILSSPGRMTWSWLRPTASKCTSIVRGGPKMSANIPIPPKRMTRRCVKELIECKELKEHSNAKALRTSHSVPGVFPAHDEENERTTIEGRTESLSPIKMKRTDDKEEGAPELDDSRNDVNSGRKGFKPSSYTQANTAYSQSEPCSRDISEERNGNGKRKLNTSRGALNDPFQAPTLKNRRRHWR